MPRLVLPTIQVKMREGEGRSLRTASATSSSRLSSYKREILAEVTSSFGAVAGSLLLGTAAAYTCF